jgi:hypothetical protein
MYTKTPPAITARNKIVAIRENIVRPNRLLDETGEIPGLTTGAIGLRGIKEVLI